MQATCVAGFVGSLSTQRPISGSSLHFWVFGSAQAASSLVAIEMNDFEPVHDDRSPWKRTSLAMVAIETGGVASAPAMARMSSRDRVNPCPRIARG